MTRDDIVRKLYDAYKVLLARDGDLFVDNANERSITHKYAEHLQKEFVGWDVDCEYNRVGSKVKMIFLRQDYVPVIPDIIIHRRGTADNLIVIEAKKSTSKHSDEAKLSSYKNDLHYRYAFAVRFFVGKDFKKYDYTRLSHVIIEK